ANSSFTANKLSIVANNSDSSLLTLTLKDANNNLVSGQVVQFTSTLANVTFSSVTGNNGVYTATLTGTTAGTATVGVTVGGATFNITNVSVELTADSTSLDATKSTLSSTKDLISADDTETTTLTLQLKDVNNNPVPDQAVVFASSIDGMTFGSVTDNKDGSYQTTLKGYNWQNGPAVVSVLVNGANLGVSKQIALNPELDATKSKLVASPITIVANDSDESTITLHLKDIYDVPVPSQSVVFESSITYMISIIDVKDNGDGSYTARLKGGQAVSTLVNVKINGVDFNAPSVRIALAKSGIYLFQGAGVEWSRAEELCSSMGHRVPTLSEYNNIGRNLPLLSDNHLYWVDQPANAYWNRTNGSSGTEHLKPRLVACISN
ncbi:MAG: Ig-like domain-containing protein, partial [Vibrio sp.]